MSKPLRLEPEAEEELRTASQWYEEQRLGLGGEFFDAVAAGLALIQQRPATGSRAPRVPERYGVRQVYLQRFPYSIVYIELPEQIRVLAVAHFRRKPGYWRARILPYR